MRITRENVKPNAVGYGTDGTGTARFLGVGSYFFPMAEGEEFDLTDLKVECIGGSGYMDPDDEYLRELNPASAGNLNCYAYVNEAFLADAGCPTPLSDADKAKVGWWKRPNNNNPSLWVVVRGEDTSLKLAKGEKMVNVRTAFLGQFYGTGSDGCNFKFTCSGKVLDGTSDIRTGAARFYFFHNYTPAKVMLTDLSVDCVGGAGYMDPDDEYFRELNPASAGNLNCYAYVNEAFLADAGCPTPLSAADLAKVGWWKRPNNNNPSLWVVVRGEDLSLKITDENDLELTPGFALLGQFYGTGSDGCDFHINFPNPLQPIVK